MKIDELLGEIPSIFISNGKYYNLFEFYRILKNLEETNIETADCIITPFYIYKGKVLEIYDYELNVRKVKKSSEEAYILNKTGKKNIKEVNQDIVQKLQKCYLEIINPERDLPIEMLINYIEYIINSTEMKERIEKCFGKFNKNEVYFEIY